MNPRVLILFNQPVLSKGHPDYESEAEVLYSVKIVHESLDALGIPNEEFGVTDDIAALLARLQNRDFDIVFNLYEGNANRSITEVYFAGLLEWLEIPFTGCPAATLSLARDKVQAKRVFVGAGISTPEFFVVHEGESYINTIDRWPVIVKPVSEDASVGIDQDSVVSDEEALHARVQFLFDNYGGPVLVERYIPGREIQVSLCQLHVDVEPTVLPHSEIAFNRSESRGFWPIYTYTAKWDESSDEFKQAPVIVGAVVPEEVDQKLCQLARKVFRTLGCLDYARIDTRVTPSGDVYVLESNPNPSITSVMIDEGLPAVGSTYNEFIASIVRNAHTRGQKIKASRRLHLANQPPAV